MDDRPTGAAGTHPRGGAGTSPRGPAGRSGVMITDSACGYQCGYYSHGQDLADHERHEHVPCPECGQGQDQDLQVYALSHKAGCPRLEPGYAYPSHPGAAS